MPPYTRNVIPPEQRFLARIRPLDSGCWEWTGGHDPKGYSGQMKIAGVVIKVTHFALLHFRAIEVPDGWHADHLCRNPPCVNPWHLEPVTPSENMRRRWDNPTCSHGHSWTPENTYTKPNGNRNCRKCIRAAYDRWKARHRS